MLRTNLFDTLGEKFYLQQSLLSNDMELATIKLDMKFNVYAISRNCSSIIAAISPHSFVEIWEDNLIHAELLKTKYDPPIPSHMKVAYSWVYLWRIKPKKNLPLLTFECFLKPNQSIIDENIESGECLFSKSFSFGKEYISIGTEDEDSLLRRANVNDNFPLRYAKENKIDYYNQNVIESTERGIYVHLPALKAGELAQLQFVIAGGVDPLANWFAADASPKEILRQAGCT